MKHTGKKGIDEHQHFDELGVHVLNHVHMNVLIVAILHFHICSLAAGWHRFSPNDSQKCRVAAISCYHWSSHTKSHKHVLLCGRELWLIWALCVFKNASENVLASFQVIAKLRNHAHYQIKAVDGWYE